MSVEAGSTRWDTAIVWFRRDLRVADHPALADALAHARTVVPLFVLDRGLLAAAAPARRWFLHHTLAALDGELRARGSGLLLRSGPAERVVAEVAREFGADVVLATRDVTPFSHRRDRAVGAALEVDGRKLALRPGLLLTEPESLRTASGKPYAVFTPFWRALRPADRRRLEPAPGHIPTPEEVISQHAQLPLEPAPLPGLPEAGEQAAQQRLAAWTGGGLGAYGTQRDGLDGTGSSHLGADLHFGTLSPLQVETAAAASGEDAEPFMRQLGWREFYHHLLFHERSGDGGTTNPLEAAFRPEQDDPLAVEAWRTGRTGVPAVDAGMRQLVTTGWMSNRARLVVASYLTRQLLTDHRVGERFFLRHLVDGDVANNRGGWRWVAGVGADAQPWFRIFNPVRQGQRFDPEGTWVRRWLPELRDVDDRWVHSPWEAPSPPPDYPRPIVDLAEGRARALAAFKAATSAGKDQRDD